MVRCAYDVLLMKPYWASTDSYVDFVLICNLMGMVAYGVNAIVKLQAPRNLLQSGGSLNCLVVYYDVAMLLGDYI